MARWRSTQPRTVRMSAPSSAAACSRGASSAWARSVQWFPAEGASRCARPDEYQRSGRGQGGTPRGARRQRRPPEAVHAGAVGNRRGRIEEMAPADDRTGPAGGVQDVGFRRRGDHCSTGTEDVRNDERRRLARPRWAEYEDRMLWFRLPPTARIMAEIEPVAAGRVRGRARRQLSLRRVARAFCAEKFFKGFHLVVVVVFVR